ncbi:DUF3576 domain-containing protein [Kordiimonas pumila]|uniref:DUF3576 domain-containing protein n=1 Tax=Kordiimonas pumila TaxID=2161677 RepID=A0ABV7D8U0_9PROT|nr:DUF3576 domain-containing protein [Kordiimonas pumila]
MQGLVRSLLVVMLCATISACSLFGSKEKSKAEIGPRVTAIGINGYLWQATLDTLSFMPLDKVEPNGGVIVTGWHSTKEAPNERVKVTVRFLSKDLRSDGLKVSVVRQEKSSDEWLSVPVQASTELKVEEAILTAARRMRVHAAG